MNKQLWQDRTATNLEILTEKPVISSTRIFVELMLDCLASGWSMAKLRENYPGFLQEDILAALALAADVMRIKPFVND